MRPTLAIDEIVPIAARWVSSARAAFDGDDTLLRAALATNFAWERTALRERPGLRAFIGNHFASIAQVLESRERLFRQARPRDVRRYFGASTPPAYSVSGYVYFTDEFRRYDGTRGFGPLCLAAMILHESVHVFDARSGEAAIHISEWDEPKFSAIAPQLQVHNPSAYASFAAQVHYAKLEWPREARFGAGRRAD